MGYKAIIIGCGDIAGGYQRDRGSGFPIVTHIGAYLKIPRIASISCSDSDGSRMAHFMERFGLTSGCADYRELLKKESPDIVSVCTPPETHLGIIKNCIEAGTRAIWCEKPLGTELEHAEDIVRLAEDCGVSIVVNFLRRFDIAAEKIRDIMESKTMGGLKRVVINSSKGIMSNGAHAIDLLQSWLGLTSAKTHDIVPLKTHEDFGDDICGDFFFIAGEIPVHYFGNEGDAFNFFEIDLLFESGRIRTVENGLSYEMYKPQENPYFENKYYLGGCVPLEGDWGGAMIKQLGWLTDRLQAGRPDYSHLRNAFENMRITHKIIDAFKRSGANEQACR